ncbi:triose-phosphate isomerase [Cohaesibacter sp. CAU 1516]|uniref:triose-phosphate isomerase n=1 Tax=Cohaesibacter sp. CAU 1516 TaxID=2576038 RepID=UPI0010FD7C5B|nr:triose-phosphate isomerase [Cohaesibacter sp. CAU 1516]TLP49049.1 triose-phosphate isomerase [Cohaesibacter sp. CAU 1516]
MSIKPLVAGNWKMNGLKASAPELEALIAGFDAELAAKADTMICPPFTLVAAFAEKAADSAVAIGAQDCHFNVSGAHTGDISAQMLADAGADAVIVGHSERRADHGETNDVVKSKAEAVWAQDLVAIICVGETEAERKGGETLEVVGSQLAGSIPAGATAANTVIAYEPVWAIGTGLTPTAEDVAEVHAFMRKQLVEALGEDGASMRLLYGGSVKASNAVELMGVDNVNGALVGGASLKAADFLGILAAYK